MRSVSSKMHLMRGETSSKYCVYKVVLSLRDFCHVTFVSFYSQFVSFSGQVCIKNTPKMWQTLLTFAEIRCTCTSVVSDIWNVTHVCLSLLLSPYSSIYIVICNMVIVISITVMITRPVSTALSYRRNLTNLFQSNVSTFSLGQA